MIERPDELFRIARQIQLLILLIPAGHLQDCSVPGALHLLKKKCAIRCAQQTVCAGDHVEAIICGLLARVMHQQQADSCPIREALQPGDGVVVAGIAVLLPAEIPHSLQRIDDDQLRVRVLLYKIGQLLVQALVQPD